MMIDVDDLRRSVVGQFEAQKADPHQSSYGDGLVRGLELAIKEIDAAISRACSRSGGPA